MPNIDYLIEQAIEAVLDIEKGYVNDPKDPGGETCWGITVAVARAYGYKGDMRYLPRETAKAIYKHTYYVGPGFAKVADLNPQVAYELFEIEVNLPPGKAAKFLQRALTGLNDPTGKGIAKDLLYPDLKVDGQLGAATLGALQKYLKFRGSDGVKVLLRLINSQQAVYYIERVEARPASERFLFGWTLHRISVE